MCIRCCGIDHERQSSCGDWSETCVICARAYLASKHQCKINRYNKGKDKLYIHIVAQYVNCQGNYPANFDKCIFCHKAKIKVQRNKVAKSLSHQQMP